MIDLLLWNILISIWFVSVHAEKSEAVRQQEKENLKLTISTKVGESHICIE
jgi:hypothetical protein